MFPGGLQSSPTDGGADRSDGGGAGFPFHYLYQDPIFQVIIIIIENAVISTGWGAEHSWLWDGEQVVFW